MSSILSLIVCPSQLGPNSSSSPINLLLHRLLSWIWVLHSAHPAHHIRPTLMYDTRSFSLYNPYNSLLYRALQCSPSLTAPKIFRRIFLSKMFNIFSSHLFITQASDT
jgi:hypothetical protein